jgi:outer membrane receptor protein involved in Fe transport
MDDLHIENFNDLAAITPGLVVPPPLAGQQDNGDVAIRGIFSGGNAPTTQFYIDETPVAIRTLPGAGPSTSPRPLIFDLDRVEVLRGPQGTLFGSSAMGGAIRYVTPQPNLTTESGYSKVEVSYTERGTPNYEVGAAYGAPIVPGNLAFRVSAWYQNEGGWIDHEDPYTGQIFRRNANNLDAYVIRPAVTWSPTDNLTVTPSFFMQRSHSDWPSNYWVNSLPVTESAPVSGITAAEPWTDTLRVSAIAIKYNFLGLTFASDSSYLDRTSTAFDDFTHAAEYIFGGTPFVPGLNASYEDLLHDISFTRALQQEFRLSSNDPDARVNWVGGLYYRHAVQNLTQYCQPGGLDPLTEAIAGETTFEFTGFQNFVQNGITYNCFTNFTAIDISEAAFADVNVNLVAGLKANLGVRVEHSVVEHQQETAAGPSDGLTYASSVLADQVGNPVTPKYGLTYQINDKDMVYFSAAKGYRAGGGNAATAVGNTLCTPSLDALGLSGVPPAFSSDSLWSYELGTKDSFLDRRITVEASAYLIRWINIQTQVSLPSCAEAFTANRGKATSQGFDLQVAAIPIAGLKLGLNVGYTDSFYPNAAYGAPSNGVTPVLNAAGDKLQNVVPWTAETNAEYSHDISPLWADTKSYLRLDFRWMSAANRLNPQDADFDPLTGPRQNPAYGILNVRLGVIHQGLDISAFINNATHENPVLSYWHDAYGSPLLYATALRPFTAGLTAYYRW